MRSSIKRGDYEDFFRLDSSSVENVRKRCKFDFESIPERELKIAAVWRVETQSDPLSQETNAGTAL